MDHNKPNDIDYAAREVGFPSLLTARTLMLQQHGIDLVNHPQSNLKLLYHMIITQNKFERLLSQKLFQSSRKTPQAQDIVRIKHYNCDFS